MRKIRLFNLCMIIGMVAATTGCRSVGILKSRQIEIPPVRFADADPEAAERFSRILQFKTISQQDHSKIETGEFDRLRDFLRESYPLVHSTLELHDIAGRSLVYRWPGTNPALRPVLLMAHTDVVPVQPGTETDWTHPPFEGRIEDGVIWGRGALDDKINVTAILEAAERMIGEGFSPERDVWFSFGHDEEIGGAEGAARIAGYFRERGIEFELVLDEGLAVVIGLAPGVDKPVAVIGVAEKGYVTLVLEVTDEGGHSSMPPPHTAVGRLAAAITRVENNPMPARIHGPAGEMLDYLAPEMSWGMRVVFGNRWLFGGVIRRQLEAGRATNALLRTTTAVTMIEGSNKENILPTRAQARVNFRILPGDTIEDVIEHVRRSVKDDGVTVRVSEGGDANEASNVSPTDSPAFATIHRTVREIFPEAIVAPSLVVGATDCRHFSGLSQNIYRFQPQVMTGDDLAGIHGTNEHVSIEGFARSIDFYQRLIQNGAGAAASD